MDDGFEEMMLLEEQRGEISAEIATALDTARIAGRRLHEAQGELDKIERNLTDLKSRRRRMQTEFKVVLLAEYDQTLRLIRNNEALLTERQDEIRRLIAQGKRANDTVPTLRARLAQVDRRLGEFGKVLEFRR